LKIHQEEDTLWISDPSFLYPLPVALLFLPFGRLPLAEAAVLWQFLSQVMILVSIYLICQTLKWKSWQIYFPILIAGAALWRGTIVTIRNGQLGAFLLLCLSLMLFLWSRKKWFQGGLVMGFLILKPPLLGLFLFLGGLWLVKSKKWSAIVGMGTTAIVLVLISSFLQPHWFLQWLEVGADKLNTVSYAFPSLWGLAATYLSVSVEWSWLSYGIILIFLGIISVTLLNSTSINALPVLFTVALSLTIFIAPYMWAYDHVLLLLPMIILIAKLDNTGLPFLLNASLLIFMDLFALGLLYVATIHGNDSLSALVSLMVLIASGMVLASESDSKKILRQAPEVV
jgi:hypothetical protein